VYKQLQGHIMKNNMQIT